MYLYVYIYIQANPLTRVETKTLHGLTGCWNGWIWWWCNILLCYEIRKKIHEKSAEISVAVWWENQKMRGVMGGQTLGGEHGTVIARQKCFTVWLAVEMCWYDCLNLLMVQYSFLCYPISIKVFFADSCIVDARAGRCETADFRLT